MKVLLFNGSIHEKGCTYTALSEVARVLGEEGIETEILWIGAQPVDRASRRTAAYSGTTS